MGQDKKAKEEDKNRNAQTKANERKPEQKKEEIKKEPVVNKYERVPTVEEAQVIVEEKKEEKTFEFQKGFGEVVFDGEEEVKAKTPKKGRPSKNKTVIVEDISFAEEGINREDI